MKLDYIIKNTKEISEILNVEEPLSPPIRNKRVAMIKRNSQMWYIVPAIFQLLMQFYVTIVTLSFFLFSKVIILNKDVKVTFVPHNDRFHNPVYLFVFKAKNTEMHGRIYCGFKCINIDEDKDFVSKNQRSHFSRTLLCDSEKHLKWRDPILGGF